MPALFTVGVDVQSSSYHPTISQSPTCENVQMNREMRLLEPDESDPVADAKLIRLLRDYESATDFQYQLSAPVLDTDPEQLPYMVFLTFAFLGQFPYGHKTFEKVAWCIPLRYQGSPLTFEHAKFGFRIRYHGTDECTVDVATLGKSLDRATRYADTLLGPLVDKLVGERKASLRNSHNRLRGKYEFLRDAATSAYQSEPPPEEKMPNDDGAFVGWSQDILKPAREGYYFGSVMIDAYFSSLEHLLALLLPFSRRLTPALDVAEFLASGWREKYKTVLDISNDTAAKKLYDRLIAIKERFRNPESHGAHEKEGLSLLVHVHEVGAIPARLSTVREGALYQFYPLTAVDFSEVCQLFDEFDDYIGSGELRYGVKYAEHTLNVSYEDSSVSEYHAASASDEAFAVFLDKTIELYDRHANMDF